MQKKLTISMSISKEFIIDVPEKYSQEDIYDAIESQIYLPTDEKTIEYVRDADMITDNHVARDLENWNIDDFEMIEE